MELGNNIDKGKEYPQVQQGSIRLMVSDKKNYHDFLYMTICKICDPRERASFYLSGII